MQRKSNIDLYNISTEDCYQSRNAANVLR